MHILRRGFWMSAPGVQAVELTGGSRRFPRSWRMAQWQGAFRFSSATFENLKETSFAPDFPVPGLRDIPPCFADVRNLHCAGPQISRGGTPGLHQQGKPQASRAAPRNPFPADDTQGSKVLRAFSVRRACPKQGAGIPTQGSTSGNRTVSRMGESLRFERALWLPQQGVNHQPWAMLWVTEVRIAPRPEGAGFGAATPALAIGIDWVVSFEGAVGLGDGVIGALLGAGEWDAPWARRWACAML